MSKDSTIELQKIDCNCNDCIHMERNFNKFNNSLEFHKNLQLHSFEIRKKKLVEKAIEWKDKDLKISQELMKESKSIKFLFDKSVARINYGKCNLYNKEVSFIPNTCQLETQRCFKHRKS